jgi:hypothetical protein
MTHCRLAAAAAAVVLSLLTFVAGEASGARAGAQVLRGKSLIVTDEKSAVAVAATGPYLAWEEEGDDTGPLGLKERNLRTGKTLTLAPDGLPEYGLGVTVRRVVYAAPRGNVVSLIAVPHGGGRHVVLSRHLAAPFDARGRVVYWVVL